MLADIIQVNIEILLRNSHEFNPGHIGESEFYIVFRNSYKTITKKGIYHSYHVNGGSEARFCKHCVSLRISKIERGQRPGIDTIKHPGYQSESDNFTIRHHK